MEPNTPMRGMLNPGHQAALRQLIEDALNIPVWALIIAQIVGIFMIVFLGYLLHGIKYKRFGQKFFENEWPYRFPWIMYDFYITNMVIMLILWLIFFIAGEIYLIYLLVHRFC
jgi:hypothetical protein